MSIYYFDYASSSPPIPEALEEFTRVSNKYYGNPSSAHILGREAHKKLEKIKCDFSKQCGWDNANLILTSGGTEANNLIIRSIMEKNPQGRLLLAGDVHASAFFAEKMYKNRVDVVPLDSNGHLSLDKIERYFKKDVLLFSCVHICNETGIFHDINTYGQLCKRHKILFHCDGVQAAGHIVLNLEPALLDFYTFSAHKFGGPRGVGGIITNSHELTPQIAGGGQESGLRSGTENIAGLAGALFALRKSNEIVHDEKNRLIMLTDIFLKEFSNIVSDFVLNSNTKNGLPGLISLSFSGTLGTNIVTEMNLRGYALSAGSACHSNEVEPSRVIIGLGRSRDEALGTIRISMGRNTKQEEVKKLATILAEVVNRQRMLA